MNEKNGNSERHFQEAPADAFDRAYGQADGFPHTRPTVATDSGMFAIGGVVQYTVQTFRVPEVGDSVFVWINGPAGVQRVHLPPKVTAAIAAQRDRLTSQSRSRSSAARAKADKAQGKKPGFKMTEAEREEAAAARALRKAAR